MVQLDIEMIRDSLAETFASKASLLDANQLAIDLGYNFAKENFDCPLPFTAQSSNRTQDHIMIDGNNTTALGCLYAGATVGAWYPITPSTSLMDGFKAYCKMFRVDEDSGQKNYCIVQAEDELAAAGIVLGANWVGARAFTPTTSVGLPGVWISPADIMLVMPPCI